MKISVSKNKLQYAVSRAERMTGKNLSLPILSTILLLASDDVLKVRSTNLDIGIEFEVPVKMKKEGIIAVPGNLLNNLLSYINEDDIVLEEEKGNLSVKTRKNNSLIKGFPYEDFPTLPVVSAEKTSPFPVQTLLNGLKSVWYSASTSDIKPEISSVFISLNPEYSTFVATDSFRLSEKKIQSQGNKEDLSILVPLRNVAEIIRVFEDKNGDVMIRSDKNQISFHYDGVYLTSRLIDGVFPDYKQIIPKTSTTDAVVLKQDLVNALKVSHLFADKFNQVVLTIDPSAKQFTIASKNADIGEHSVSLDAALSGEPVTLRFNQRYLADCLQSVASDSVSLQCNGEARPVVVRNVGDRSFTALVMPLNT
ncbi:MAG: DNA polymerase III subunit beta [Parcubacteria group bacterium]|nr:DNA polymerase III subunit beta [Parcubacteria group bacterium]